MSSDAPVAEAAAPSLADRITKDEAPEAPPAAQVDGAGEIKNGSGLEEPEFDVEVKLNDLQADPNNPLFSVKSFEELGL
jgi:ATP-dependent RNA helicase DDX19/DBP5